MIIVRDLQHNNWLSMMIRSKQANYAWSILLAFMCLSSMNAYAAQGSNQDHANLALDQSQQVYFDQFAESTYSLQLLQAKNKFDYRTIVIGGSAEADLQYWHGDNINTVPPTTYQTGSGLYLTQTTLDLMANITPVSTLFLSGAIMQWGQGGQNGNFYYFPHAFLLIGNTDLSPIYASLGINTLPFGVFTSSGTWDISLASAYFNPQQAPQFSLGYSKNNLNLNLALYHDEINYEYHTIASLSYSNSNNPIHYTVGLGYLTDLKTNSTGTLGTIPSRRTNPYFSMGNALDINASLSYKIATLSGEFLTGSKIIATNTGKPAAYSVALSLTPTLYDKVTTFGVSHSVSLYFNNIPATLPGLDAAYLATDGLKSNWAFSVSRPIYKDNIILGFNAEKVTTYASNQSSAFTLDLLMYL